MNGQIALAASAAALLVAAGSLAQDYNANFIFLQKSEVVLAGREERPIRRANVLFGNPNEEGIYVMRIEFGAAVTSAPHHHDQDRFITIICGVWGFGRGDSRDCDETVPMTEGALVMHPKGAVHFDGSCNGEPVVVQIMGMGPVKAHWLEPGE